MNYLPRYSTRLDAGMQPYAPDSKYLRTDMGAYPGGVPYLTSEFLQDENVINKNVGRPTNGSIRTSVLTRTRDQNSINVNQLAFIDTHIVDQPVLLNLQALNWWLVNIASDGGYHILNDKKRRFTQKYEISSIAGTIPYNELDAQKAYIMERFKLYGVVVNRDVDNNPNDIPREQVSRDFTCTVRGVCHVLDYWSNNGKLLNPYDSCFLVLKKILITKDMTWQHKLTNGSFTGNLRADSTVVGTHCWQIFPYHCSDSIIPVKELMWEEGFTASPTASPTLYKGSYWRCGNVHEYPDIGSYSQHEKRKDTGCVARNITYLHDGGRGTPVHFYLKIGDNFN